MINRPILNTLNRVLVGGVVLVTIAGFLLVPLDGNLPVHWGPDGQVDTYAPAHVALIVPAIVTFMVVAILFVLRPAGMRQDMEAGRPLINASISFIAALSIMIAGATIAAGLGHAVDLPRLIVGMIGAMLLVIGNYLPKTQPNWIAGVRLPWTLRDPDNWRTTHRWAGWLTMLGGLVAIVAAIVNPPTETLFLVLMIAALLPAVISIVISYFIARQKA